MLRYAVLAGFRVDDLRPKFVCGKKVSSARRYFRGLPSVSVVSSFSLCDLFVHKMEAVSSVAVLARVDGFGKAVIRNIFMA